MERFETELVLKGFDDEAGTFEGLAAVYGNLDRQGDIIEAGAFAADDGKEIPLLWNHKGDVVGLGKLEDGPEGMKLKGRLLLATEAGREAYARLKAGAARGLSVGFRLLERAAGDARRILAGAIQEVSITSFPANPEALVTTVKSEPNPYAELLKLI